MEKTTTSVSASVSALSDRLSTFFAGGDDTSLAPDDRLKTDPKAALKEMGIYVDNQVIEAYLALDDEQKNKITLLFHDVAEYNNLDPDQRIALLKEIKPIIERFLQLEQQPSQFDRGNW